MSVLSSGVRAARIASITVAIGFPSLTASCGGTGSEGATPSLAATIPTATSGVPKAQPVQYVPNGTMPTGWKGMSPDVIKEKLEKMDWRIRPSATATRRCASDTRRCKKGEKVGQVWIQTIADSYDVQLDQLSVEGVVMARFKHVRGEDDARYGIGTDNGDDYFMIATPSPTPSATSARWTIVRFFQKSGKWNFEPGKKGALWMCSTARHQGSSAANFLHCDGANRIYAKLPSTVTSNQIMDAFDAALPKLASGTFKLLDVDDPGLDFPAWMTCAGGCCIAE